MNKDNSRSIRISDKTWKKLMKWKLDLDAKSIDDLIERMLKIVTAQELEK